ncbi:MAG TPA: GNAT family N-acetyltransferase [Desulfobacterales bacterium]
MSIENLSRIFEPRSIAVIGASEREGSIGGAVLINLASSGFAGTVYPVNANRSEVLGRKAYARIADISGCVDLAVMAVPIGSAVDLVKECTAADVGGIVILSAGGKEIGPQGEAVEQEIAAAAAGSPLRIIGPNCMGLIHTANGLNASFAPRMPLPGKLAFISQSGAVCGAVLDLSLRQRIGFHSMVSLGSMLDVDFGDMIDYLGGDPGVSSIVMYVENLTQVRKFMSAARAVSRVKPLVVLKAGRTPAGAAAAASHTGALAGDDAVYDTAFRRAGVLRVKTFEELFDCAELLAAHAGPTGSELLIVTNAGGAGVMAVDALADFGLRPAALDPAILERLDAVLPAHWSRANPIDMLGDATVETYRQVVEICLQSPQPSGLIVMLAPQAMIDPAAAADAVVQAAEKYRKPVLAAWLGGPRVEGGREAFNRAGIPSFETPERAVRAFANLLQYRTNIEMLQEIPSRLPKRLEFDRQKARSLVRAGLEQKSEWLTEPESKTLLAAYGIPVNPTEVAFSDDEAAARALRLGFPVALKIYSRRITHKSDIGGVALNLQDAAAVRDAYGRLMDRLHCDPRSTGVAGVTVQTMLAAPLFELILGAKHHRDFGPVMLFGAGGVLAEALQDRALALPPLNRLLARRMMENTRIYKMLAGYRNRPSIDLERLEEILIRLGHLVTDFPEIGELDINPLFAGSDSFCAVDARIRLQPSGKAAPLHLVISPYPESYETRITTRGLERIFVRPIRPEDAPMLRQLIETLSARSLYQRFLSPLRHLPPAMLARFTQIDYDREIALVALPESPNPEYMMGVGRVIMERNLKNAEFSVLVGDPWQGKGIGAELLKLCLRIAKERNIESIWGLVLTENTQMLSLGRKLGFALQRIPESNTFELRIDLRTLLRI